MQPVKIQKTTSGQLYIHIPKFIERHFDLKAGKEVWICITSPEHLQRIFENGEDVIAIRLSAKEEDRSKGKGKERIEEKS